MKIVEFGDDGSPKILKQTGPELAHDAAGEGSQVKAREFPAAASSNPSPQSRTDRIKILEFGRETEAAAPQNDSARKPGPFGAARVPQSIKIVDFDREKGRPQARPAAAPDRTRGMKIVETE